MTLGTYVITNDPRNLAEHLRGADESGTNIRGKLNRPTGLLKNRLKKIHDVTKGPFGAWEHGYVHESPLYIGYRDGNRTYRTGYNSRVFQDQIQNVIHREIMRQHYYNRYDFNDGIFFDAGYTNPWSIYLR